MTPDGRVLVADDDVGIRESTVGILRRLGYAVYQAEDGQEALDILAAGEVDAVVLDVKMPRCDGISVVEQMFPEPPPPSVLLVSAYDIDPRTRSQLGRRVHKMLRKPVPPRRLIEAV